MPDPQPQPTDAVQVPAEALDLLIKVAQYVSTGRGAVDVIGPYPDATARYALDALGEAGLLPRPAGQKTDDEEPAPSSKTRLRKIETRNKPGCQGTYAVLIDNKVEGYVDKYVHQEVTRGGGQRSGRSTRTAMYTTWGYRRPGTLEVPPGCSRRSDAVDWLVKSLGNDS